MFPFAFAMLLALFAPAESDTVRLDKDDFAAISYGKLFELHSRHQEKVMVYPEGVTINLSIPDSAFIHGKWHSPAPAIPIRRVDFNGATFNVTNCQPRSNGMFLFSISDTPQKLTETLRKKDIDNKRFSRYGALKTGRIILDIQDQCPWAHRTDPNDSRDIFRKDVILLEDGKAQNAAIAPYNTAPTVTDAQYVRISDERCFAKDLNFVRNPRSSQITNLLYLRHKDGVTLEDIMVIGDSINRHGLYGDRCIAIRSCTNTVVRNVEIVHTYSHADKYGYGIELDNVYNTRFYNITGYHCKWGVFGGNNLNKVYLEGCELNRFDLHCYGRDVECVDCVFRPSDISNYNSNDLTCLYGTLRYRGCTFRNFQPLVVDVSFNIYTGFDFIIEDCRFILGDRSPHLVSMSGLKGDISLRPEHRQRCLPNLTLRNVEFVHPYAVRPYPFSLFRINGNVRNLGHIRHIILANVTTSNVCLRELSSTLPPTDPADVTTTQHNVERRVGKTLRTVGNNHQNTNHESGLYYKYF